MWIPVLASIVGVFFILLVMFVSIASSHKAQIMKLNAHLFGIERTVKQLEEQLDEKRKHVQKISSQLEKARDETKQAKKRVFELSQEDKHDKDSSVDAELELLQEQTLEETRAKLSQSRQAAAQATEESARLTQQTDQLKAELDQAKQSLAAQHQSSVKKKSSDSDQLTKTQKENQALKKKLESANRKARTDSQIYMVTNSKLNLAMEKISALEKALARQKSSDQSAEPRQSETGG